MAKVYRIYKFRICPLIGERCGESYANRADDPKCEVCCDYLAWKKSGLSVQKYLERKWTN